MLIALTYLVAELHSEKILFNVIIYYCSYTYM